MPCAHPGHVHDWKTTGELHIDRCEKYCAFCPPAKANKDWRFGWFLRRHVRNVHAKDFPDLVVSVQWGNDQPVARRKRAKTAPLDFAVAKVDTMPKLQPSMSEPIAMNVTFSLCDNVGDYFTSQVDPSGEVHDSNEFDFDNEINGDSFSLFDGVIDDFIMPDGIEKTESTALEFIDAELLADINSINDMVPHDAVVQSIESIDEIMPYETIGQSTESIDEMVPYDAIMQSIESIDKMIPYGTLAQSIEALEDTEPYEVVGQSIEGTDYMLPVTTFVQSDKVTDETPPYDEIVQSIETDDDDHDDDDDDEPFETIEPESEDADTTVSHESSMSSTVPPPTEEANALRQNIETAVMWAMESAMKQHEILNVLRGMVQEVAAW